MTNRLAQSRSPYLLQHASNPVDWYPWGAEAFEKALREDKPVFLSIGYSTCHWCHVMAHESFEDAPVAELLNTNFVAIKVDREERPDIDAVYMTVAQLMTGTGGWPLSLFLTPEKKPFFAGTYIPRLTVRGMIGMTDLLPRIIEIWRTRKNEILGSAESVIQALQSVQQPASRNAPEEPAAEEAYEELSEKYDPKFGGFGKAPKFPAPHQLMFLLRYWKRTGERQALEMAVHTLTMMRHGGVYDQIGFGFHRYSTDPQWHVPHFEKMLYDQALLSYTYCEAYQATGNELFRQTASEVFEYVLRDMQAPGGGFYSAEDADSDGGEGKFYLWNNDELRALLEPAEHALAREMFGIDDYGNFIDQTTGKPSSDNILHRSASLQSLPARVSLSESELAERSETIRQKLFRARSNRIRPFRDEKILTDWNGLTIAALAKGYQIFGNQTYLQAARAAADIVFGIPLSHSRGIHADNAPAFLTDYAFLAWGMLELYQTEYRTADLKRAVEIADMMIEKFRDDHGAGFFLSGSENERLISNSKELYDGALPSGNSAAYFILQRLSHCTGNPRYEPYLRSLEGLFAPSISQIPSAFTMYLCGLEFEYGAPSEIVLIYSKIDGEVIDLLKKLRREFLPTMTVLANGLSGNGYPLGSLAPYTRTMKPIDDRLTIYKCRNYRCEMPTTDVNGFLEGLKVQTGEKRK